MKKMRALALGVLTLVLASVSAGCSAAPAAQAASFTDPFAYCAAVGTINAPDARYTGPKVPDDIISGFKKAAGLESSTEPSDMFKQSTIWRCMDAKVYACNFGANLPCDSQADTNKTPTQAMTDFCAANPASDFIPMSVTGHATVYMWRCFQGKPDPQKQIVSVDAQGYLANIWYPIQPPK